MKIRLLILFSIIILASSCTKEQDITTIIEEPFTPITNIEIESLVVTIKEDIPFTVTIDDQVFTSLGGGVLLMKNVLLSKMGSQVVVRSTGYFDEVRYVIPNLGANHHLEVELSKIKVESSFCNEFESFDAASGGVFSGFRVNIEIEPNAIVDAAGNIYDGTVRVFACNIFAGAYFSNNRKFPHHVTVQDGKFITQNIGGGLNIVMLDNLDNRLFLKEGVETKLSFELQNSEQVGLPDELDLTYYDFTENKWINIGAVVKQGDQWEGKLSHLGLVTWGPSFESKIARIRVSTEDGVVIPNKQIYLFTDLATPHCVAFTDNEGYCTIPIPLETSFTIRTFQSLGAFIFADKEFPIVTYGGEEIIELEDFLIDPAFFQVYLGQVLDCNEQVVKNSALVMGNESNNFAGNEVSSYFFSRGNGTFHFAQLKTEKNPIKMQAFDFDTDNISDVYNTWNYQEETVEFGSLSICQ
ncbi:MAG: hypothetical protein P1U56_12125 [Saprospiraceae bacterium]|nr:hypothetical protein [Saprospiraceae bacterium]